MTYPAIATVSDIEAMVSMNAAVAIGVSGGKDSQAAALATFAALDRVKHAGPRILIHSDLGSVEWKQSLPACEALAAHLGTELVVVRRKAGGLMERWESRHRSSIERYRMLSTVTLVPCWSTPSLRFCTSEQKTHVIVAELKRRFKGQHVINVTGVRRAESVGRSRGTIADIRDGIWNWRPLSDWSTDEVFACIAEAGLDPHEAYTVFGMSRVSCVFCIMSNIADLIAAAAQPETLETYLRMVLLEIASTFAFQGARWLGDVAPHLLPNDMRAGLIEAKRMAARRVEIEKSITPAMKYVKGWPLRMLTDDEADILARVRREISDMLGINALCLTRHDIHDRYAALMAEHERKAA